MQPAMGVHALHTRGVVALHPPLSYCPTAHAPAHGVHTRSAVAVHAAVWKLPFGQPTEHVAHEVSALPAHALAWNWPGRQLLQALHSVSLVFVHAAAANCPCAHAVQGAHVLPSPRKPGLHEQVGLPVESSHVASAAQPACAQIGEVAHLAPWQVRPVAQSIDSPHVFPSAHLPQVELPPQSTSLSRPFVIPSVHEGSGGAAVSVATSQHAATASAQRRPDTSDLELDCMAIHKVADAPPSSPISRDGCAHTARF